MNGKRFASLALWAIVLALFANGTLHAAVSKADNLPIFKFGPEDVAKLKASILPAKDAKTALDILHKQVKSLSATSASTTRPKSAKDMNWTGGLKFAVPASHFVQKSAKPQPTLMGIDNIAKINPASAIGVPSSFDDIPDFGIVRVYLGINYGYSYDKNPFYTGFDFGFREMPDRSSGSKILQQDNMKEGDLFFLEGFMWTEDSGERVIVATGIEVICGGFFLPSPLAVPLSMLGPGPGLKPSGPLKLNGVVTSELVHNEPDASSYTIGDGNGNNIKILDLYPDENPPVVAGEPITITGTRTYETDETGKVSPVIHRQSDIFNPVLEIETTPTHTVSGTVTADAGAAGQTVWVGCPGASDTAVFDENGVAHYQFRVGDGVHNIFARTAGYGGGWQTGQGLRVINALPEYGDCIGLDFTLLPMMSYNEATDSWYEQKEVLDISTDKVSIPHDGISTTEVTALLRDFEGKRYIDKPVAIATNWGKILSCDSKTDGMGKAHFVLQSSTKGQTAIVTATCGSNVSKTPVFFHNPGDPFVAISAINGVPAANADGQIVSGSMSYEIVAFDTDANGCRFIKRCDLLIDGVPVGTCAPSTYDEQGNLVTEYAFDSSKVRNGPGVLTVIGWDGKGNSFESNPINLVFQNACSEFKLNQQKMFYERAGRKDFTFDFVATEPWTLKVVTINDDKTENVVWTASGTTAGPQHLIWNGKKPNGYYEPELYWGELTTGNAQNMTVAEQVEAVQSSSPIQTEIARSLYFASRSKNRQPAIKMAKETLTLSSTTNAKPSLASAQTRSIADSGTHWQLSTIPENGKIFIASAMSKLSPMEKFFFYLDMVAVGRICQSRDYNKIVPIYEPDLSWKSSMTDPDILGMKDYWYSRENYIGVPFRNAFLITHGEENVTGFGDFDIPITVFQLTLADNTVESEDKGSGADLLTDLRVVPGSKDVTMWNVCYSMGWVSRPDYSVARAMTGCEPEDDYPSVFIGWQGLYSPNDYWFKGHLATMAIFSRLIEGYTVNQAIYLAGSNWLTFGTWTNSIGVYTYMNAESTWLE